MQQNLGQFVSCSRPKTIINLNNLDKFYSKIDLSLSLVNWKFSVTGYVSPKAPNNERVKKCRYIKSLQIVNCIKKANQK